MAFATQTLDVDEVLISLERKLATLEIFAKNQINGGKELEPLVKRRSFRSDKALYNAVESSMLRIEKIVSTIPKTTHTGRSHIQAATVDFDPGEVFYKEVGPYADQVVAAAQVIAGKKKDFADAARIVGEQAIALGASVKAEAALVSRAAKMAKPANPTALKAECESLVDASADCADFKYAVDVRSPLHDHVMALADAAAALGWVVAPAALKHVRDYVQIVGNLSENILARYIELGCDAAHSDFAEALNAMVKAVAKYVEREHPAGLRWNYAAGAVPKGYKRANRKVAPDAHPFGDFLYLMHGAVTEHVLVSREIGGVLAKAADGTLSLYYEMLKAIENASTTLRPDVEGGGGELRMLLMSVQHELVPIVDRLKAVDKKHKYYDHCMALVEFSTAHQWCTATLNKMSPVTYLVDIDTITRKCLDRIDERFKRDKTYKGNLHRRWTKSVRDMLTELQLYVRTHHPNELMFDTQRSRRSFEEIHRKKSLSTKLDTLKKNSKTRKWVQRRVTINFYGRRKEVNKWRRIR